MKVLIAVPCSDKVYVPFVQSLMALDKNFGEVTSEVIMLTKNCTIRARNALVSEALALRYDYILFIDADMVFPSNSLRQLLAYDTSVIGCNYPTRSGMIVPTAVKSGIIPQMFNEGLPVSRVEKLGFGLVLIKVSVFLNLPKPWFVAPSDDTDCMSHDYKFCDTARSLGYPIYCHNELSKQVGHVGTKIFTSNDFKLRT